MKSVDELALLRELNRAHLAEDGDLDLAGEGHLFADALSDVSCDEVAVRDAIEAAVEATKFTVTDKVCKLPLVRRWLRRRTRPRVRRSCELPRRRAWRSGRRWITANLRRCLQNIFENNFALFGVS